MNISETFISKYKPKFLKDLYINDDLLNIIKYLLKSDYLNILLLGPNNSGKTTMLECIIREYYNLNGNARFPHNNIMIINNLKEQGVNYYRNEMKTFCQSNSTIFGKKKMVIIDDIDTLSEQSQQVFRNYIDKYKNNVNFICVCSNIQKIIESIQSRLNIFKIIPLSMIENKKIMNNIIKNENIKINDDVKQYLIKISNNNIRNIIHNLEKIHIYSIKHKNPTLEICKSLCSNISISKFEEYIECIKKKELSNAINIIYNFHDYGYSVIDILEFFFYFIKITDNISEKQKYNCIPIICNYISIFNKLQEHSIELALFTNDIFNII